MQMGPKILRRTLAQTGKGPKVLLRMVVHMWKGPLMLWLMVAQSTEVQTSYCPMVRHMHEGPYTVGVLRSEVIFNEDPSKLDGTAHFLWKGVVPMEMIDNVVEALETRPCETWDPVFNDFFGVHRGPYSGTRRMFALPLPHVDVERSGVGYHECGALVSFANLVLARAIIATTRVNNNLKLFV